MPSLNTELQSKWRQETLTLPHRWKSTLLSRQHICMPFKGMSKGKLHVQNYLPLQEQDLWGWVRCLRKKYLCVYKLCTSECPSLRNMAITTDTQSSHSYVRSAPRYLEMQVTLNRIVLLYIKQHIGNIMHVITAYCTYQHKTNVLFSGTPRLWIAYFYCNLLTFLAKENK